MANKLVKESMEPMGGAYMQHNDEFVSQHEVNGHKHHSKEYSKHAAGFKKNRDTVKAIAKK